MTEIDSEAPSTAKGSHAASVRSVSRALQLLALFTPRQAEWSVGALAKESGLHKSVVTRLMATMANEGFVVQSPTSRTYRVGGKAFAVGNAFSSYVMLSRLARPILEKLTARCGHSSSVGVPDGDRFVTCVSIQSTPIRVAAEQGQRQMYHGSSVGKALLAGMPDDQRARILHDAPLVPLGPNTITDVAALMANLEQVRRLGYAVTREESSVSVGGVAAAVGMADGGVLAAIGIAYPVQLVPEDTIDELGKQVIDAAADLCELLAPQGHSLMFPPTNR
jgi:DNA-binding IclR family transcriptional regulator